jgi:hypothetical protein
VPPFLFVCRKDRFMTKPIYALCVMACLWAANALAQQTIQPVWRCGHEFTNQPRPGENCQQVDLPADITMTAPRKRQSQDKAEDTQLVVPRLDTNAQRQRDSQARNILNDELGKLLLRCTQLPANSTELVRCLADEAALRRELARMP